ncbi:MULTISPECIES: glycoside hydrolase family 43 protein [unclassified Streptomyces]|uniref:glycoside hydrolase family 43 protein n=1 Tax=unclassified Streptomyces TaxID=2593676 RepID=UPI0006FA3AC9|nr:MULTISPECIES: glycoside hydrolase family 43 protein [unclassified Streptomyces]KQX49930.1 1,3-beta-glucanase [Streptomyces sp. Root1304]KRA80027.1 1,3-beta-glucanase [Streptomyces sp. Root66D1]
MTEPFTDPVPGAFGDPVLPGFRPDPSVCRVEDDYYLVTSSFEWFPGLPVFHSRDLVNWRRLGSALDRPSQLDLDGCGPSRGLFAPTIRHHDGLFHLVCTLMDGGGHFVVTATDPAGPWSEPSWLEGEGFDPSLFFDDGPDGDGGAWFTAARVRDEAAGRTEIWMRAYVPGERRLTGPEYVLWSGSRPEARWSEAPHLYKVDGGYLLLTAEGGTDVDHSVVAARADSVTGPYEGAPGNPVLPPAPRGAVTCTGHADLVQTPDGDWRAVLLGVRPGSALGRETFLSRISWRNGLPLFSPVAHTCSPRPLYDDFAVLAADWNSLRTPREPFRTVGDGLRLRLRPERLGERTVPSLLVRPQEQPDCDVSTEMRFTPAGPGEEAGLAVVVDDDTHLLLLRTAEGLHLRRGPDLLARTALPPGPVRLGVSIRGFAHTFVHAAPEGPWQDLATVEATFLTPLFTSVQLGLYATSQGHPSTNEAHFPWFALSYPQRER